MSSIQNLAKSLSKVVNKRRRLKSESAVHQNSPANAYINKRLSERRVSDFDDTWIRPYADGIARANDMKNSAIISYERCEGNDYYNSNTDEQKDDLDVIFQLSSFDQSRDEFAEPEYIDFEGKIPDVNSMVSVASEDNISLYCDALSRKPSFVRKQLLLLFILKLNVCPLCKPNVLSCI